MSKFMCHRVDHYPHVDLLLSTEFKLMTLFLSRGVFYVRSILKLFSGVVCNIGDSAYLRRVKQNDYDPDSVKYRR